jgi:hypothetical protein
MQALLRVRAFFACGFALASGAAAAGVRLTCSPTSGHHAEREIQSVNG